MRPIWSRHFLHQAQQEGHQLSNVCLTKRAESTCAGDKLAAEVCLHLLQANWLYAQQQCAPDAGCEHLGDQARSIEAGADVCTVLQQAGRPLPPSPYGASLAALCGQPARLPAPGHQQRS